MKPVILAIDEGTTGTTALLMDLSLRPVAEASIDFEQHFPKPGWVEHDLNQIWKAVLESIRQVLEKAPSVEILGIGITNQRETLCFWNRKTGEPIARAIVWQDRRTSEFCSELKGQGHEAFIRERSGLVIDPYFSGTKLRWALDHWPDVKLAYTRGELAVGTIDSFLAFKLTGNQSHVTEPSNASRTLLFDLKTLKWSEELAKILGVPLEVLPEVRPSSGVFGKTHQIPGIQDGTPILGILGDQQSALLGQACIDPGEAKCTYGTGAFLLMNTGDQPVQSQSQLLTTIAWNIPGNPVTYALEGSAFIAGAAVQWVRDGLKWIRSASEIEALASGVADTEGVYFVPALTGLGAPHWNPNATGLFTGLTRGTTQAHMARAVLEGIAFQNVDLLIAMERDSGKKLKSLNVDGGAAANSLLMQMQADFLGVELKRPQYLETTSLGAVFAAGLGAQVWKDLQAVRQSWKKDRSFTPQLSASKLEKKLQGWTRAIRQAQVP